MRPVRASFKHTDHLLPSRSSLELPMDKRYTLGKMLVKFQLGDKEYSNDIHIYPSMSGVIISWKAAKALGILPKHYPAPLLPPSQQHPTQMRTSMLLPLQVRYLPNRVSHKCTPLFLTGKSEQWKGKTPYIIKTRCKTLLCQYPSIFTFHLLQQTNRMRKICF